MSVNQRQNTSAPPVQPALQEHADMLSQVEIIKVRDHVYVAVGYAIANMIMIEGTNGIIIVDTTESGEVALKILKEFRTITTKPIKAIIQTHFHTDHINGTRALLDTTGTERDTVMIIAHSTLYSELIRAALTADSIANGGIQQFGMLLKPNKERICCGIGPFLSNHKQKDKMKQNIIKPTHTFDKEAAFKIAGVNLKLYHTPGETDDQITVWIPEWKVVMPADNIYKTFPNLYAIRGSPPRDCVKWYTSLDRVRRLNAEHMVPSHTRPVTGAEQIHSIITSYRDAIQFINDQTVRYLNNGLEVDDIVERVNLPPCLASHPYLQQFYGMVSWSVRSVASGHLGWFDKNPTHLWPLSSAVRAKYLNQLLSKEFSTSTSGVEKLLIMAEESLNKLNTKNDLMSREIENNATWILELCLQAMELTEFKSEQSKRAVVSARKCFEILAATTANPNARNFLLTKAKELGERNMVSRICMKTRLTKIARWPVEMIMKRVALSFKAENVHDNDVMAVVFEFPDVDQVHSYTMRHCILEHHDTPELIEKTYDAKATMSSVAWKQLLLGEKSLVAMNQSKALEVDGSLKILERFMNLLEIFQPNVENSIKNLL